MLLELLGMDALLIAVTSTRTKLWFGHGCNGYRMLLEHAGDYGLGIDALVTLCSWNTKEIMYETTPPPAHLRCKISSTTRPLTGAVSMNQPAAYARVKHASWQNNLDSYLPVVKDIATYSVICTDNSELLATQSPNLLEIRE